MTSASVAESPRTDGGTSEAIESLTGAVYGFVTAMDRFRSIQAQQLGLSTTDVVALVEIARRPGQRPGDLTRAVGLGVAGTTSVIDKLVRSGFARRTPDPDDRRSQNLFLTPAGEHAFGWIADHSRRTLADALSGTDIDPAVLRDALERVAVKAAAFGS